MDNKYRLTYENKSVRGISLYRIQAIRSFGDVKEGDLGGFVESESNLSHIHNCWIYDDAAVYEVARVAGDTQIRDNACLYEHSLACDMSIISENAKVYGSANIFHGARIRGNSQIGGMSNVYGSIIHGSAHISGMVDVYRNAEVCEDVILRGAFCLGADSRITGDCILNFTYRPYIFKVVVDHGNWIKVVIQNINKRYLVSNTLEKIKITFV